MPDDDHRGDQPGATPPPEEPAPGRMRFQDETTTPREPTLAERRAREQAARREAEEHERGRKKRKRILVGAGVTVGVVALIAVGYSAADPDDGVQAQCVDETGVIVEDSNCVTPAGSGGAHYGGGGFYPIFIGTGGRQYHYTYGGSGTIGQRVQGGTTAVPKQGTRVTTSSGRTIAGPSGSGTVSRGGLGVSGGGSSSGS